MKKVVLSVVASVMVMGSTAFAGGNSLGEGSKSLGFETANSRTMVIGKYGISQDMAVVGGFGFSSTSSNAPGASGVTELGLAVGARKYLKVDDFAPFVGGSLAYTSNPNGVKDSSSLGIQVDFGAEYFLAKQFSLEGSVGIAYGSATTKVGTTDVTNTSFGTTRSAIGANLYF